MATLEFQDYSIYYEVYGKGKPLLIQSPLDPPRPLGKMLEKKPL